MIPMGSNLNLVRTTYERRIELEQTSWIIHRGCATRAWGLYRLHVDRRVTGMNAESDSPNDVRIRMNTARHLQGI
jgi:hypothetical protein